MSKINLDLAKSSLADKIVLAKTINDVSNKVDAIRDELADICLLLDIEETKDVYSMSYDEYMELPGNVRL